MEEKKYKTIEEFLESLRRKFGEGEEESVKVAELKRIKQGGKKMEEFVQEFKRVARESRYRDHSLIEEFKKSINGVIRRKLIEVETQLGSIKQWYDRATILDRN